MPAALPRRVAVGRAWVWPSPTDLLSGDEAERLARLWCSAAELERVGRLRLAVDRHARRVAYVVTRHALGQVSGSAPDEVRLWRDDVGRPVWDGPGDVSLAHARGHVLVAVGRGPVRVGVDVETVDALDVDGARDVAAGLAPAERERLARLDGAAVVGATLRSWVRLESVLKADGRGLAVDPAVVRTEPVVSGPVRRGRWVVIDLADDVVGPGGVGALAVLEPGASAPMSSTSAPHPLNRTQ